MAPSTSETRPVAATPTRAFLRGGFFLALASISWVIGALDGDLGPFRVVFASALTLLGLVRVGSGVAMLVRERRG